MHAPLPLHVPPAHAVPDARSMYAHTPSAKSIEPGLRQSVGAGHTAPIRSGDDVLDGGEPAGTHALSPSQMPVEHGVPAGFGAYSQPKAAARKTPVDEVHSDVSGLQIGARYVTSFAGAAGTHP